MNDAMLKLYIKIQNLMSRDDGQDLVEYALVVALIALGATVAMTSVGTAVKGVFTNIGTAISGATTT